jgi:hypothetical protein
VTLSTDDMVGHLAATRHDRRLEHHDSRLPFGPHLFLNAAAPC